MAKIFPKLMTDTKAQIQKAWRTPSRMHFKITTLWHIIFKLQKIKDREKYMKEARRKRNTNKLTKKPSVQRNKDKNYSELLVKDHVRTKENGVKYLKLTGNKTSKQNTNLEFYVQ